MHACQWAGETARLLFDWLAVRLPAGALAWLVDKCQRLGGGERGMLPVVFSAVPRKTGKADLELTESELKAAGELRPGWSPSQWSIDQAARACFLLASCRDAGASRTAVSTLLANADLREAVAVYRSFAVLPFPEIHRTTATEGVRSNTGPIFDAISLNNPYPQDHFDESSWNRMVLKALFLGRPLELITGLRERANPRLAESLLEFAKECQSAGRPLPQEIEPLVTPFVNDLPPRVIPAARLDGPGDVGC